MTTNIVVDNGHSSVSALSWMWTAKGDHYSVVKRLSLRLLNQSKTIFSYPTCIWHPLGTWGEGGDPIRILSISFAWCPTKLWVFEKLCSIVVVILHLNTLVQHRLVTDRYWATKDTAIAKNSTGKT